MGFMKPKTPSGPSPQEMQQREDAARQREKERIDQENTAMKAEQEQTALAEQASRESKRKAFAGALTQEEGEEDRKKFLKGA